MAQGAEDIHSRIKWEHQLLKSVFDGLDSVIYACDMADYKVLYSNLRAVEEFGEAKGRKCYEMIHGREQPCEFCNSGLLEDCDVRNTRVIEYQNMKNGSWYRSFVRFADWPNGRKVRLDVAIDVTPLRLFENNLLKEQSEKAAVLDNMTEHVILHGPDMKVVWANRSACESVGLKEHELVGRMCAEIWYGRDTQCPGCPVERALMSRRREEGEIHTPDGRYWIVRADPVIDPEGELSGVVEVSMDVTDLRLAEKKKIRSHVLESVIETLPDPVLVFDVEGVCVLANGAYCDMFDLEIGQIIGNKLEEVPGFDMQDADEIERIAPLMLEAIQQRERLSTDMSLKKRDGSVLDVSVTGGALFDVSGNPTHIMATIRPLT